MHKLSEDDREKVKLMIKLGMNRPLANTIIYLLDGPAFSLEIQEGTGLKQPEVSNATGYLRAKGWLNEDKVRDNGIGRPRVKFSLNIDPEELLNFAIFDGVNKMKTIEESIQELEVLLTG